MGVRLTEKGLVKIVAIVCLTALQVANFVFKGPDSTVAATVVAAIAGIAGYAVGRRRS